MTEPSALLPDGLLALMRADPGHAPEHLALAAVDRFGPEATADLASLHAQFPTAAPHQLALMIRTRFVRLARLSGAAAGVTGLPGAVVDLGVLAWTQARMVVHLAAALGHDPSDRDRAAEILVLQGIHRVLETSRTALQVAAGRARPAALMDLHEGSALQLVLGLTKMVGMKVVRRSVLKVVPIASIPFGAMSNAGSTKRLADKAIRLYSTPRALTRGTS